jgi:cation-transporting ATPase 13A1
MPYPHPQIHRALRGAFRRPVLRLSDVLRRALVSGRVLVLLALHGFHARRLRVHRRLPGEQASRHDQYNSVGLGFVLTTTTQRVRTLTEFRTMSITPYNVMAYRDGKWVEVISSELVPGDLVSVRELRFDKSANYVSTSPRPTSTRRLSS